MKSKVSPIYLILGLFLFKVGVVDNIRNIGHRTFTHVVASEGPAINNLRPIR